MEYILLGCGSFLFFYLFDLNKILWKRKWMNVSFGLGVAALSCATLALLLQYYDPARTTSLRLFAGGALSVLSLFLLVYSLFFALPFSSTYADGVASKNAVIDRGVYALCRHPGVHAFFLFYLFLYCATGIPALLTALLCWWLSDILHVWVQDRFFFSHSLQGYEGYRRSTPFLLPNPASIKKCLRTLRQTSE